jgi:SWI/SNF-related matrix-associated actin-dependent regulator of chromatin subfamily A member 5
LLASLFVLGRLAEKQKNLGKDEMLSMIQFGASEMFQSKNSTVTDDDIDAILAHGESKTAEGLKKLASLGDIESLQSFTFDTKPTQSLHEFEGEDFSKKTVAQTWIAPAKRERKTDSYNISNYYAQLRPEMSAGASLEPLPSPSNIAVCLCNLGRRGAQHISTRSMIM